MISITCYNYSEIIYIYIPNYIYIIWYLENLWPQCDVTTMMIRIQGIVPIAGLLYFSYSQAKQKCHSSARMISHDIYMCNAVDSTFRLVNHFFQVPSLCDFLSLMTFTLLLSSNRWFLDDSHSQELIESTFPTRTWAYHPWSRRHVKSLIKTKVKPGKF